MNSTAEPALTVGDAEAGRAPATDAIDKWRASELNWRVYPLLQWPLRVGFRACVRTMMRAFIGESVYWQDLVAESNGASSPVPVDGYNQTGAVSE